MAVINLRGVRDDLAAQLKSEAALAHVGYHEYCVMILEARGEVWPVYSLDSKTGAVSVITNADRAIPKKIADISSGGGAQSGGGNPSLPPIGKLENVSLLAEMLDRWAIENGPDWLNKCRHALGDANEVADANKEAAMDFHSRGVSLDRKILMKWGLADTPSLPAVGKAQDGDVITGVEIILGQEPKIIYGLAGIAPDFNEVIIPIQARGEKIIPAEDGADYFVAPRQEDNLLGRMPEGTTAVFGETWTTTNIGKQVGPVKAYGFPEWSPEQMKKIAEEEPGGLMACSPEILTDLIEVAAIDGGVAAKLYLAGVKLDREILVRWGLAENYKPKLEDIPSGVEKSMEEGVGIKEGATAGEDRRNPAPAQENSDGVESGAVGVGKSKVGNKYGKTGSEIRGGKGNPAAVGSLSGTGIGVGESDGGEIRGDVEHITREVSSVNMDALRDICAGNIPFNPIPEQLSAMSKAKASIYADMVPDPYEVDLCGFKSYNETDGENYICGKEAHGPKIKHGEWIKV